MHVMQSLEESIRCLPLWLHLIPLRQEELTIWPTSKLPDAPGVISLSQGRGTGMSGGCVLDGSRDLSGGSEEMKKRQTDGHLDTDRNAGSGGLRS